MGWVSDVAFALDGTQKRRIRQKVIREASLRSPTLPSKTRGFAERFSIPTPKKKRRKGCVDFALGLISPAGILIPTMNKFKTIRYRETTLPDTRAGPATILSKYHSHPSLNLSLHYGKYPNPHLRY
jgi:hypothetical protein